MKILRSPIFHSILIGVSTGLTVLNILKIVPELECSRTGWFGGLHSKHSQGSAINDDITVMPVTYMICTIWQVLKCRFCQLWKYFERVQKAFFKKGYKMIKKLKMLKSSKSRKLENILSCSFESVFENCILKSLI